METIEEICRNQARKLSDEDLKELYKVLVEYTTKKSFLKDAMLEELKRRRILLKIIKWE